MLRVAFLTALLLAFAAPSARADHTVGPDSTGRMHAFLTGADGHLYQAASTARGAWGSFSSLGGALSPGPVAVALNRDGRLDVFARGSDNALWHIWEIVPGGAWSAWTSLGGLLTGAPDVAANADGRLEVFARGLGGALMSTWQLTAGGSWTGWTSRGGVLLSDPTAIRDAAGELVVFARGSDNALYKIQQTGAGGGWSAYQRLGGSLDGGAAAVANATDGHLEVFARGSDNALVHAYQVSGSTWSAWTGLGVQINGDPAAAPDPSSKRVHVFARGTDNALWHVWQEPAGGGWAAPSSLGGQFGGDPVLGTDGGGGLQVFAPGPDGALLNSFQNGPAPVDWSPFTSLGKLADSAPPPLTGAPLPVGAPASGAVPLKTIVVTLGFTFSAGKRTTRLKSLVVKGLPRGATVDARCAHGCSSRSLVKRGIRSASLSLAPLVKRPLKVGTKITITVSAPGTIAAVKTLTIRAHRPPTVATRCLAPGAKSPRRC